VHTLALAEALAEQGISVDVWSLARGGDGAFFRAVDDWVGVRLVPFPEIDGEPVGARIRRSIEVLAAAFDAGGYDIVHAQDCISANSVPRCVMPVRSDPPADAEQRLAVALAMPSTNGTEDRRAAMELDLLDDPDFGMLAALQLPGVASIEFTPADTPTGGRQQWLLADDDASFAVIDAVTGQVTQHGPRRVWDEVEAGYRQWDHAGRPARDRYGLSIDRDGKHRYWLDIPESLLWTENPRR
jgi:hypothetical protein